MKVEFDPFCLYLNPWTLAKKTVIPSPHRKFIRYFPSCDCTWRKQEEMGEMTWKPASKVLQSGGRGRLRSLPIGPNVRSGRSYDM